MAVRELVRIKPAYLSLPAAARWAGMRPEVLRRMVAGGALPVYWCVAGKSPRGQGSIALLERLVHGWRGKCLVLLLLGFAATDFIMVKTISLADADSLIVAASGPPAPSTQETG